MSKEHAERDLLPLRVASPDSWHHVHNQAFEIELPTLMQNHARCGGG
jgi:hypothetical protein